MRVRVPLLYICLGSCSRASSISSPCWRCPGLAPKNAWARLVPLGPANTMIQIPPLAPGNEVMPMMAPDVRYAFCRFDLANGPVRLKGSVANDLWLIALYTPEGENFYTVAGADMKSAQLDLIIAPPIRRWRKRASMLRRTPTSVRRQVPGARRHRHHSRAAIGPEPHGARRGCAQGDRL